MTSRTLFYRDGVFVLHKHRMCHRNQSDQAHYLVIINRSADQAHNRPRKGKREQGMEGNQNLRNHRIGEGEQQSGD